jgi:hypothetical protein
VQEIDSSARKCQKVVQEIENLVPFLAPTKDTITKDNKQKTKALFILPDFISKETWDAYKEMRQRKRAPLTDRAASLIVKELEKLKAQGHDPEAVLNQSIMKSWTGVFPVSTASGGGNGGNGKHIGNAYTPRQYGRNSTVSDRTDAALDRVIEEAERVRKSTVSNSIRNAEGDDVPDAIMQRI